MNEAVKISKQRGFISNKNNDKTELKDVYYISINKWIAPSKAAEELKMCLSEYVAKLESYGACFVLNNTHMGFAFHSEEEAQKVINEFIIPKFIMERLRRAK